MSGVNETIQDTFSGNPERGPKARGVGRAPGGAH